ncbi:MAG TPA: DUF192 domain-containing protein [Anaeromyxobacteraceae bacterium]|nr:DUF192 domain-containing protein [Anaeromyxobacteraceae bacterium]
MSRTRAGRAAVAAALALLACPSPPSAGGPAPGGLPRVVVESGGLTHPVVVELAADPASRERGLMFRKHLEDGHGMLFVFDEEAEQSFWMKNTLIPLDMIFIDEAGAVVGIVERAEPHSTTLRSAGAPSRYVLEVAGGVAAERGIRSGDRVRFENVR